MELLESVVFLKLLVGWKWRTQHFSNGHVFHAESSTVLNILLTITSSMPEIQVWQIYQTEWHFSPEHEKLNETTSGYANCLVGNRCRRTVPDYANACPPSAMLVLRTNYIIIRSRTRRGCRGCLDMLSRRTSSKAQSHLSANPYESNCFRT